MGFLLHSKSILLLYKIYPSLPIANGIMAKREILARGSKALTAERMLYHMPTYNKLVRDKIPHIITSSGKECRTRILDPEEYKQELRTKLIEESEEYVSAANDQEALEELADMLEVIRALAEVHGANAAQLDKLRADKAEARGGFQERVYLIDVDEA